MSFSLFERASAVDQCDIKGLKWYENTIQNNSHKSNANHAESHNNDPLGILVLGQIALCLELLDFVRQEVGLCVVPLAVGHDCCEEEEEEEERKPPRGWVWSVLGMCCVGVFVYRGEEGRGGDVLDEREREDWREMERWRKDE